MTTDTDVVVIGGGIIGMAIARELARGGRKVVLLEREACGAEASSAAAGLLQPFAEEPQAGPYLDASLQSLSDWPHWCAEVARESGQEIELSDWGTLYVAFSEDEEEHARRAAASVAAAGQKAVELAAPAIGALVPDLAPDPRIAVHVPCERRVDNVAFCAALAHSCQRQGVEIHEHSPVSEARLAPDHAAIESGAWSGTCAQLVLAAGAWSGKIGGLPSFPVRPWRGQILVYDGCPWEWNGAVRCGHRYAVRRGEDQLLIGSTLEDAGFEKTMTSEAIADLMAVGAKLFPELANREPTSRYAGLRPGSSDERPLLGRWRDSPLWLATGHFRSGILLAPWSAQTLSDWMLGRETEGENPFSPNRFSGLAPA